MPSGKPRAVRITGALPTRVSAVLAQRLFVEKAGLPSPLLNQIKRLAAASQQVHGPDQAWPGCALLRRCCG